VNTEYANQTTGTLSFCSFISRHWWERGTGIERLTSFERVDGMQSGIIESDHLVQNPNSSHGMIETDQKELQDQDQTSDSLKPGSSKKKRTHTVTIISTGSVHKVDKNRYYKDGYNSTQPLLSGNRPSRHAAIPVSITGSVSVPGTGWHLCLHNLFGHAFSFPPFDCRLFAPLFPRSLIATWILPTINGAIT
jgi:hypothetical protein